VEFRGYGYDPARVKHEDVELIGYIVNEGRFSLINMLVLLNSVIQSLLI